MREEVWVPVSQEISSPGKIVAKAKFPRIFGTEATSFYKHLSSMLAQKWDFPYSSTLCWLLAVSDRRLSTPNMENYQVCIAYIVYNYPLLIWKIIKYVSRI